MARAVAWLRDHPLLTPLLAVYGAGVVLVDVLLIGPALTIVNLVLLAAYVAVIHFATRGLSAQPGDVQRTSHRSRDIVLVVTVAGLQLAAVVIAWFLVVPSGLLGAWAAHLRAAGIPSLLAGTAVNAALTVPLLLAPTAIAIAVFRVAPRDVGLNASARNIGLGLLLAGIGIALAVGAVAAGNQPGLFWQSAPMPVVIIAILLQSLINGLPEELAFRGVILGRLLQLLGRPGNSVMISSLAFTLYHVPSHIASAPTRPIWAAALVAFAGTGLAGLVFGYLFYRTRSIWPGVIWHTSVSGVGLMFA